MAEMNFQRVKSLFESPLERAKSNWKGVQLVSVYLIIGILFFFLPETGNPSRKQAQQQSSRAGLGHVEQTTPKTTTP